MLIKKLSFDKVGSG